MVQGEPKFLLIIMYTKIMTYLDNSQISDNVFITLAVSTCRKCPRFHLLWILETRQGNSFISYYLKVQGVCCFFLIVAHIVCVHTSGGPRVRFSSKVSRCGQISLLKYEFNHTYLKENLISLIWCFIWLVIFMRVKRSIN